MSQFQVPPRRKVPMATSVDDAFPRKGSSLGYEYDFGSTTELRLTVLDRLVASLHKPIELAARNEVPPWQCDICGNPATEICAQCIYDEAGLCCPAHAKTHECGEDMLLPVRIPRAWAFAGTQARPDNRLQWTGALKVRGASKVLFRSEPFAKAAWSLNVVLGDHNAGPGQSVWSII